MQTRSLSTLVASVAVLMLTLLAPVSQAAAQTSDGELVRRVHQLEQRVARLEAALAARDSGASTPTGGTVEAPSAPIARDRVAALVSVTPIEPSGSEHNAVVRLEAEARKLEDEAVDARDRVSKLRLDRAAKAKRAEAAEAAAELTRPKRWVVAWLGDRYVGFVVGDAIDISRFAPGDMITWDGRRHAMNETLVEFEGVTLVRPTERPDDFTPRPAKAPQVPKRRPR